MSKALKCVLEYAFNNMNINRVEALVLPENTDSFNLLLNNHFKSEGLLKSYRKHNNKYYDLFIFAVVKKDYLRNKKTLH